MTATPSDDAACLAAWQKRHDEDAFRELCLRYSAQVAATCRRQGSPDVDEATQAVFIVLARRAGSVPGSRLAGWLHLTARRVVAYQHRTVSRRRHHEQEAAMEHARQQTATESPWVEARTHLDAALSDLSPGRREAVIRFYFQGMSQAAIATELGCSVDAVKTRVHEGLERLRTFLHRRGVTLGATALAAGLASESVAAESTLAATCVHSVLAPSTAPGATALATHVNTAMIIKTTSLAAAAVLLVGSCIGTAFMFGAEPPPAAKAPVPAQTAPIDPGKNAALPFLRALIFLPERNDPLWDLRSPNGTRSFPDPLADAAFERKPNWSSRGGLASSATSALSLMGIGVTRDYCDWGREFPEEGVNAPSAHVGGMVDLVKLAVLRARWHATRAEYLAAVDDLLMSLRAGTLILGKKPDGLEILLSSEIERHVLRTAGWIAPKLDAQQLLRLVTAIASLPTPPAVVALEQEILTSHRMLDELLALPINERTAKWLALTIIYMETTSQSKLPNGGSDAAPKPTDEELAAAKRFMSDDSLAIARTAVSAELKRWQSHFQKPQAERLRSPPPERKGTDQFVQKMVVSFLTNSCLMVQFAEARTLTMRQAMMASLAYLDRGEAGLAEYPDHMTAKPFPLTKTASGFTLASSILQMTGRNAPYTLVIGDAPPLNNPNDARAVPQQEPDDAPEIPNF